MKTKTCNKCGASRPLSAYHRAARNRDGRYHTCKSCRREIDAAYYVASDKKAAIQRRRARLYTWMSKYKRQKGCKYCDEREPVALDFHHSDSNKEFSISNDWKRYGEEKIKTEVEKCDVVCSNCHRKIHAGIPGAWA